MLKKFRSLQGVPLMSTLGEESEEPSSPTKVFPFRSVRLSTSIYALLQAPTVTVNGSSGDAKLVEKVLWAQLKVFHPDLGIKHPVTEIHSHLPEFEKVWVERWSFFWFWSGSFGFGYGLPFIVWLYGYGSNACFSDFQILNENANSRW